MMGRDRDEVLARIQRGFENQYNAYVKLKRENIQISDYETLQACKRMQGHVIYES